MRELIQPGVILVLEADGLGERVDRFGGAGEEMPAGGGAGAAIAFYVVGFLCGGEFGSFSGIEADGNHVEFLPRVELQKAHGAGQSGERFAAEHRAAIVNEIENQRLPAEVVSQLDGLSGFVAESEIGRDLGVEVLIDADVLQGWRTHVSWRGYFFFVFWGG